MCTWKERKVRRVRRRARRPERHLHRERRLLGHAATADEEEEEDDDEGNAMDGGVEGWGLDFPFFFSFFFFFGDGCLGDESWVV